MTRARRELVSTESTPYYHCICRCVRRAFLCGEDSLTGNNYEHRKIWVVSRLRELSQVFAVEICAYAVMSNHYHVVVRLNQQQAEAWSESEVIQRWNALFSLPALVSRYIRNETDSPAEVFKAREIIEQWRSRLIDLSWFMRCLNEHLARRANEEDRCKGRFWEGRFKSVALLDDAALLTCMSYVDLNPIRASMAELPEASDFTSIQQRIHTWQCDNHPLAPTIGSDSGKEKPTIPLMPLGKNVNDPHPHAIHYTTEDYIELVDWAGRAVRASKRGSIAESAPSVLARLGIDADAYLDQVKKKTNYATVIGPPDKLQSFAERIQQKFIKGISQSRRLYRPLCTT